MSLHSRVVSQRENPHTGRQMSLLNPPLRLLSSLALSLFVTACSSGDSDDGSQKAMSDSMASRMMRMDQNKRSSFDSAIVTNSSDMGRNLQKRKFKAADYVGNTSYQVPKTLKQRSFSGADDLNRLGSQSFSGSQQKNHLADDSFSTSNASEAKRTAQQQGQTFSGADDAFKTNSFYEATRSQAQNKRPLIVKPDGGASDETPYTEDQIRRMVNRR